MTDIKEITLASVPEVDSRLVLKIGKQILVEEQKLTVTKIERISELRFGSRVTVEFSTNPWI